MQEPNSSTRLGSLPSTNAYGQQFGQQYVLPGNSLRLVGDLSKPGFGPGHMPNSATLSIARMVDDRKSLAYLVTLSLLCLFAAPTVLAWHVGRDPDATFWIGRLASLAWAVPVFVLVVHLLHVDHLMRDGRAKVFVTLAAAVPAVLLCSIGLWYMWSARKYTIKLFSEECSHPSLPAPALELQEAYGEAQVVFDSCVKRLVKKHGGGLDQLPRAPLLQNCQEWARHVAESKKQKSWVPFQTYHTFKGAKKKPAKNWNAEWWYLATLEANSECSGFCAAGPPLWSAPLGFAPQRCAPYVALKLQNIGRQGAGIFWTALLATIVFFAMFAAAQPIFFRAGYVE